MANLARLRTSGFLPLAAVAVWQVLASAGLVHFEYLPSPREVLLALVDLARSGELADDVAHTLGVALAAAAITLSLGAGLGLAIGLLPVLRRFAMATIDFLRAIPAVTLVPVAVLQFGPSVTAELMLAVYAGLWPIVLNTAGGVAAVHARHYDVARMLRLSPAATVRKIVIPATVPAWLVGARLSAIVGLLVALVAEMLIYRRGLGGGLIESLDALAPARMWAYALVCGVIGVLLSAVLRYLVGVAIPGIPAAGNPSTAISAQAAVAQPVAPLRGLLPVAVFLVVWQLVGSNGSLTFPPPREWFGSLAALNVDGSLLPAITFTLTTYVCGLALATVLGGAVGIAIGGSRRADAALTPSIDFLAAVPGAALVPVIILVLGPTQLSGVALVALIVSWPILLNTAAAMRTIPVVRLEMSRSLGLSPAQRWAKVIVPSVLPGIMLGVRVASALALIVTLLFDIFGAGAGVGRLLVEAQQHFDSAAAWGLLLLVGTFGYLTSGLLAWAEPWFAGIRPSRSARLSPRPRVPRRVHG